MCLVMGTNRNFCSFFNQKYICFYLFKYYLRNDPFLRTQNDDMMMMHVPETSTKCKSGYRTDL